MAKDTRKSRMEQLLKEAFRPVHLVLNDETMLHADHQEDEARLKRETHFSLYIRSETLKNMSRTNAHRAINQTLKQEFMGGLHALSINLV